VHPLAGFLSTLFGAIYDLGDNARAREALRNCLPDVLKDPSAQPVLPTLKSDVVAQRWLLQLLRTVYPEDSAKFTVA